MDSSVFRRGQKKILAVMDTPSEASDVGETSDVQMEVKLWTKLEEKFRVPEDAMVVPGSLARVDISSLLNDTLELEKRVPFDFLIGGEYLRGSIADHCRDRGILSEKTLDIEYVMAMEEPESSELTEPEPSWISGIAVSEGCFYTSSMSGDITKYDSASGKQIIAAKQGTLPISSISLSADKTVVSVSRDGSILFSDCMTLEPISQGKLSVGMSCVNVCPFDGTLALTGTISGEIHLWNVPVGKSTKIADNKKSKKRASTTTEEVSFRSSIPSVTKSTITGIQWISLTEAIVSSLDGMLQIIHPLEQKHFPAIATGRSISTLVALGESKLATGHADGRVIFWNIRMGEGSATLEAISACRSHSRMVTSLALRPGSEHVIASASLDGSVKLFDVRANSYAIQSVTLPDSVRALALAWSSSERILSGASDGIVRTHVLA